LWGKFTSHPSCIPFSLYSTKQEKGHDPQAKDMIMHFSDCCQQQFY